MNNGAKFMIPFLISLVINPPITLSPEVYTVPDLCRTLTDVTGVKHTVDADLEDYPLFISVKPADASRVEKLIGIALRGKWVATDSGLRLTPVIPTKDEDFEGFQRQYKQAFSGKAANGLPVRELYEMKPGTILRFGVKPGPHVRPLPASMQKSRFATPKLMWRVRRLAYGVFDHIRSGWANSSDMFTASGQTQFAALPPTVESLLKSDLAKPGPNWLPDHFPSGDPISSWANPALKPVAAVVGSDFVIALPDSTWYCFRFDTTRKPTQTVRDALGLFSNSDEWITDGEAAIACLTPMEAKLRTQTYRKVFEQFVDFGRHHFMVSLPDVAFYLAKQRAMASDAGSDAAINAASCRVVMSEAYGSDFPYNVRLFASLSKADWEKLKSKKGFPLSALSKAVISQIETILLQSMARIYPSDPSTLERGIGDPGTWPSLEASNLSVRAVVEEVPVLLTWTGDFSQVETAELAGAAYKVRVNTHQGDIRYQTATNLSVKITISNGKGDSVETGFTTTLFDHQAKPIEWKDLPAPMVTAFKKGLAAAAARPRGDRRNQ